MNKRQTTYHNKNYTLFITKYKIKPENIIKFNDVYNSKQKFTLKCENCDNIFETSGQRIQERTHYKLCTECTRKISGEKQSKNSQEERRCEVCGNIFYEKPHYKREWCSDSCKSIIRKNKHFKSVIKNIPEYEKKFNVTVKKDELYNSYVGTKSYLNLICSCGKTFEQSFFNLNNKFNRGIKDCACKIIKGTSNGEIEVRDFINEKIKTINNKYINGVNIDIISDNFCVEYNGLYWHSDEFKTKNFHLNKTNKCEEENKQLFHIFENEWKEKQNIWKSIINTKMNLNKKIYARKCVIKEVKIDEAKLFCEENHMQGYTGASIKIGLYYNNELVSLMTFKKPRYNKDIEYELIRFCSKLNISIIGGAGKLLKYFETKYKPKSLISYANRRWSQGNVYEKLGFTYKGSTSPNFFYFKDGTYKLESRINFQNHNLKNKLPNYDERLSPKENISNSGYRKIYDSGNKVYIKRYE